MYVVICGGGKVGWNLARELIEKGNEVTLVEQDRRRYLIIEEELEHAVQYGDAKEKYLCERTISRVNNPRNLQHFELLGIQPAVSATDLILRLIEHEVPQYGLVHLLDLPAERLEIIEIEVTPGAPAASKRVDEIAIPDGSLIISVLRSGEGFVPKADTVIEAGDEGLLVLDPGLEDDITRQFAPNGARPGA